MVQVMDGFINYGSTQLGFNIQYSKRKTMTIVVQPNGEILAKVPEATSLEKIKEKIHKRASWIITQQLFFKSFGEKTSEKRFISGESHFYLGRQYLLRVLEGKPDSIKYKGRYFEIICSHKSKAKQIMNDWYRAHAKIKFAEISEPIIQHFLKYNVTPSEIYIQEMANRWGSCTNKGKIILNTELIKAPRLCIEYVIIHEHCHLVYRNHNKNFYDLLTKEMPDWEKWKNKLEHTLF